VIITAVWTPGGSLRKHPATAIGVAVLHGAPFGAAEYIGDLSTNSQGNGHAECHLIVQEAFSSTLVNGQRTRVDLNRVGIWFADAKDDEFCLPGSGATPFDGDNEAGVQACNSANADPLPAP
jgi:hypothetical protein